MWFVVMALVCAPSAYAPGAHAQVYEIGAGGVVNVREGGGAVVWRDTSKPIEVLASAEDAALTITSTTADARHMLERTATRHGLSVALLEALVWQESRWNNNAVSPKGAMGLTQLMPATARALGVNPRDPAANLEGGARYLRMMIDRFGGDVVKALAAYNAGPERVERAGGIPAIRETQGYVAAIMARLSGYIR
jgi:soluble lytic murein transglycosylase-like protein